MYCENCHNDIPIGKQFYRHQATDECFCSLDCLTDWLIYSMSVTLEVNEGETEDEEE